MNLTCEWVPNRYGGKSVKESRCCPTRYQDILLYPGIELNQSISSVLKSTLCGTIDTMIYSYYKNKHTETMESKEFKKAVELLLEKDLENKEQLFPKFYEPKLRNEIEYNVVYTEEKKKELREISRFMRKYGFETVEQLETMKQEYDKMKHSEMKDKNETEEK
jgi:hypothetical protein